MPPMSDRFEDDRVDIDEPNPQLAELRRGPRTNPPWVTEFFDRFYEPLTEIANKHGIDKTFLLALAAHESEWFRDRPEREKTPRTRNNLFGLSRNETPLSFGSVEEGSRRWEASWANRLRDSKTENEFVQRLLNPPLDLPSGQLDYRPYNSVDPDYEKKIRNQIDTVKHRLQIWHRDKIGNP